MTRLTYAVMALAILVGSEALAQGVVSTPVPTVNGPLATQLYETRAHRDELVQALNFLDSLDPEEKKFRTEEFVAVRAGIIRLKKEEERLLKEIGKTDTPEMKQARGDLQENTEKERDKFKKQAEARKRSNLFCAVGQRTDSVIVSYRASGNYANETQVRTDIHNATGHVLDITQVSGGWESEIPVKGLCIGGSLTISQRAIGCFSNQVVQYKAVARTPKGEVLTWHSMPMPLQSYGCSNRYTQQQPPQIWEIK